ncbi:hypothetical protein [Streptomyces sp. NPDC088360]|uniref:hypothetical protein n=1 Tax=Streptomyces sp. NPDC088360 TaxID=3154515 RepID=UPI00344DF8DA
MRCSVSDSSPSLTDGCLGTATHLVLGSVREEDTRTPFRDPVCEPCANAYTQQASFRARVVPLHVYEPDSMFAEIIEGHRLVKDEKHEARCHDCGTTGSPNWFRFQTNGCRARPESIEVVSLSRDARREEREARAAGSARLWWGYAVEYLHTHVEDWRPVTDHDVYCAFFTFRDREYGLTYNEADPRIKAVKLPNRGRPEPEIDNPELDYEQAVFYFHGRMNDSGSEPCAIWTPGHANVTDRELVILYTPEGRIHEALRIPGLRTWAETVGAICDAFGPIRTVILRDYINE